MKRKLIIGFGILLIFGLGLFFGLQLLNRNTISCSSDNKANGVSISQYYLIKFDGDVVNNIAVDKKYIYEDQTKFDIFSNIVIKGNEAAMANLENDYIKFDSNNSNKTYTTKLKVDVKNASKDSLSKVGLDKSLDVNKSNLEAQGLVCK